MIPESHLDVRLVGDQVVPSFFGAREHQALGALLDEVKRCDGQREGAVGDRLAALLLPGLGARKQRMAIGYLNRLLLRTNGSALEPKRARETLFRAAAHASAPRPEMVAQAASYLGVTDEELERALFADLPGQRVVRAPPDLPDAPELALRLNLAMAQGLVARASVVSISLSGGNAREAVRQARLRRLICSVRLSTQRGASADTAVLEVSGAYALFKHTLIYGRALGELVPALASARGFRLEAACRLYDRPCVLRLGADDPIFPAGSAVAKEGKLEARLFRELERLSPAWDVEREPEPFAAKEQKWLVFPDLVLRRKDAHGQGGCVYVEIVGFWTERYLAHKLEAYGEADVVFCLDDELGPSDAALPAGAKVVRFHKRIDAQAVLALAESAQSQRSVMAQPS